MRDVDQPIGMDDPAFHQVEKIGAGREIYGTGLACGCDGFTDGCWSNIFELFHAAFLRLASSRCFCASSTALVIPK
jgi:hypothetical protein